MFMVLCYIFVPKILFILMIFMIFVVYFDFNVWFGFSNKMLVNKMLFGFSNKTTFWVRRNALQPIIIGFIHIPYKFYTDVISQNKSIFKLYNRFLWRIKISRSYILVLNWVAYNRFFYYNKICIIFAIIFILPMRVHKFPMKLCQNFSFIIQSFAEKNYSKSSS